MRASRSRWIARAIAAVLATVVGVLVGSWVIHNLGTVEPGRVYRSGQLGAGTLGRVLARDRIRTVLNLRGSHPESAWYRDERAAALAAGATQIDVAMSSCEWMSRAQARAVIGVLDSCEYPILIHCRRGAERTGLVSAFTALLRPGGSMESARSQFSLRYFFLDMGEGAIMPDHLDQYEAWLQARGEGHTPARFRSWINEGFRPGQPSREDWPYDPYPLVVVTRPEAPVVPLARSSPAADRERK